MTTNTPISIGIIYTLKNNSILTQFSESSIQTKTPEIFIPIYLHSPFNYLIQIWTKIILMISMPMMLTVHSRLELHVNTIKILEQYMIQQLKWIITNLKTTKTVPDTRRITTSYIKKILSLLSNLKME